MIPLVGGDLRLAFPVLLGWVSLLILQLNIPLNIQKSSAFLLVVISLLVVLAVLSLRWKPILSLSMFTISACVISYAVRLPSHVETFPWDAAPAYEATFWTSWAEKLRVEFQIASAGLPDVGGELIPGLTIGDTTRLSEVLSQSMKTVSLTHITAVSGANIVIVTATVMGIVALLGAGRKLRLVLAVFALIAFVILVTPQSSVLRAAVMSCVVLITLFGGRPGSGIPLLALTSLIMLLWDPWWATDFGFILSVAATAGILLFSQPLARRLSAFIPVWLAVLISIPVAAQLMCQPVIILLSPQIPTYGILANVLAAPAAPLATILGLLAIVFVGWAPSLASFILWVAWLPAQWIGHTAIVISRFPEAAIPWPDGIFGSVLLGVVSLAFLVAIFSSQVIVRRILSTLLVGCVLLWAIFTTFTHLRFSTSLPSEWSIAVCDVGQGDALVLKSEDQIAVIDLGRTPQALTKCLSQLGITRINLLVITHFDKDHVGGLSAVMGKVDTAIVGKPENAEDDGLLKDLVRSGAHITSAFQGMNGFLGKAAWKVLWPDGKHPDMEMGNPGSVVLFVAFPEFSALFLADVGREAQASLMNSVALTHADVVKVAHHGSADQSVGLYEAINPELGLFSVGQNNEYGHPRKETLEMLQHIGALTPRTDESGLILITQNLTGLSVWTER